MKASSSQLFYASGIDHLHVAQESEVLKGLKHMARKLNKMLLCESVDFDHGILDLLRDLHVELLQRAFRKQYPPTCSVAEETGLPRQSLVQRFQKRTPPVLDQGGVWPCIVEQARVLRAGSLLEAATAALFENTETL